MFVKFTITITKVKELTITMKKGICCEQNNAY